MDGMQNRTERDIEGMNAKKWGREWEILSAGN